MEYLFESEADLLMSGCAIPCESFGLPPDPAALRTPSEKSEKSETAALNHEVMRRSTIPWLRSLLQTQTFSLAAVTWLD